MTKKVSIHSPRRSEGRLALWSCSFLGVPVEFQSTPPAEARGDLTMQAVAGSGEWH